MSKEQLLRAHFHGTRRLRGRRIWARKKRAIGADGREQPQWHFYKEEMEELAKPEDYNDPIVKGWLSPGQVWEKHGIPYHSLRVRWANGTIKSKDVAVLEKWCARKKLTYSNERDVARYAKQRELPSKLERACEFLKELLCTGPQKYREIKKQARLKEISEKALRRAKKKLNIVDSQPGHQTPSYWYFPEDKDKLSKTKVAPEKRPLRTKALKILAKLMPNGVRSFKEAEKAGKENGIDRGTMYLAWREARETGNAAELDPAVVNGGDRNGHEAATAPLGGIPMASAASRSEAANSPRVPLPQQPHPVVIVNSIEQPVPVREIPGRGTERTASQLVLHANDWTILEVLAQCPLETMYQVDIETGANLSRKTVSKRLRYLRRLRLVHRPQGNRGGEIIIDRGREALRSHSTGQN
jgi:hypothetical protein